MEGTAEVHANLYPSPRNTGADLGTPAGIGGMRWDTQGG
jgi:hypothetical protein